MGGYNNPVFGLLFDLVWRRCISIEGLKFYVPGDLTRRSFRSRFLFDLYEKEERYIINKYIRKDYNVIEFGAGIGVVSCITNKLINRGNKHIVYEANKELIPWLNKNKKVNNCDFNIINKAVSDGNGVCLSKSGNYTESYVQNTMDTTMEFVNVVELDELLAHKDINMIICDIEGAEKYLINNYRDFVKLCNNIMIEIHNNELITKEDLAKVLDHLSSMGYTKIEQFRNVQYWSKLSP